MNVNANSRLIDVTVGQYTEYLLGVLNNLNTTIEEKPKNYVCGIAGIASLFGVSKTTVWKYRSDGWLEPAIKQNGRTIICDADMAMELFAKRSNQ